MSYERQPLTCCVPRERRHKISLASLKASNHSWRAFESRSRYELAVVDVCIPEDDVVLNDGVYMRRRRISHCLSVKVKFALTGERTSGRIPCHRKATSSRLNVYILRWIRKLGRGSCRARASEVTLSIRTCTRTHRNGVSPSVKWPLAIPSGRRNRGWRELKEWFASIDRDRDIIAVCSVDRVPLRIDSQHFDVVRL